MSSNDLLGISQISVTDRKTTLLNSVDRLKAEFQETGNKRLPGKTLTFEIPNCSNWPFCFFFCSFQSVQMRLSVLKNSVTLNECVIAGKFPLGPRSHKRCQWCSLESHCFYLVHSRCCFDWIRFHKSQWSLYDPHTTIVLHQQQRSVQQTLFWPKY